MEKEQYSEIRRHKRKIYFSVLKGILIMRKINILGKSKKEKDRKKIKILSRKYLNLVINMGPTFIKLGQVLSTRPDMFPQEFIEVMSELQDLVPPAPFAKIKKQIEEDFHKNINEIFQSIEETPIQAASLGQVHIGKLNGIDVAIKVRRPNIQTRVLLDLAALKSIIPMYRHIMGKDFTFSLEMVLEYIENTIFDEMNYLKEAEHLKEIKTYLADDPTIKIPNVIEGYVTERVLTMEYVPGTKITDIHTLQSYGLDLKDLAKRVVFLFTRLVLEKPIFHADPHPGNISVQKDGTIILYDFGMVGKLEKETRGNLFYLYSALVKKDPELILKAMIDLEALDPYADTEVIKQAIALALKGMSGKRVSDIEINELFRLANAVFYEFPFRLPPNLITFIRMYSLMEGVAVTLDKHFNMIETISILLAESDLQHEMIHYMIDREFDRIVTGISSLFDVPKNINRYISTYLAKVYHKTRINTELAIIGGAILIASAIIYPVSLVFSITGFGTSMVVIILALLRRV